MKPPNLHQFFMSTVIHSLIHSMFLYCRFTIHYHYWWHPFSLTFGQFPYTKDNLFTSLMCDKSKRVEMCLVFSSAVFRFGDRKAPNIVCRVWWPEYRVKGGIYCETDIWCIIFIWLYWCKLRMLCFKWNYQQIFK